MKKSIIIAVFGLTVGAESSFGQGSIIFNSYLSNSVGTDDRTSFSPALGGGLVGAGYSADLLWSLTPITEAAGFGALNPLWNFSGSGSPSQHDVTAPFGTTAPTMGYFQADNNFVLNPYTPGTTVYFEVIAYQTAFGYANSSNRGHSASFSTTLATSNPTFAFWTPFTVNQVPEPTMLALAGLGGLASLVIFRRKQS